MSEWTWSFYLTHWGRVTHICVSTLTVIGSDNGLSPGRRQAIIWTDAGILLIGTLGINFSEILIEIRIYSFKKMGLKVSSAKWRPFCLGLNVLTVNWAVIGLIYMLTGEARLLHDKLQLTVSMIYMYMFTYAQIIEGILGYKIEISKIFRYFCSQNSHDTQTVYWLIKKHLFLSVQKGSQQNSAQKKKMILIIVTVNNSKYL